MTFQALLLTQANGATEANIATLDEAQLPADGDVLVAVDYSTINFKDGWPSRAVRRGGARPMVAGIDGAGSTVLDARTRAGRQSDKVVLQRLWRRWKRIGAAPGTARARLKGGWLVRLPGRIHHAPGRSGDPGTAGYTAMLSVLGLEPRRRQRTGAAPAMAMKQVTRRIGRRGHGRDRDPQQASAIAWWLPPASATEEDFLKALGAAEVIDRARTLSAPGRSRCREGTLGGRCGRGGLARTGQWPCARVRYGGVVTACGPRAGRWTSRHR
ncbi:oxidoreductase [Cupriavidus basilensis]